MAEISGVEGFISETFVSVQYYYGEYDSERVKGCRVRQPQRRGSKEGRTTVWEVIGACGEGCVSWKRVCACVRDEMQKER